MMEPVYYAMSWLLLRVAGLWDAILPEGRLLDTDWDWVLAIVGVAVVVRLLLLPLFAMQLRTQRAMRGIAPRVQELQAQYRGDPQTLRLEMTKLYQEAKVNPLRGCLPLLVEIPIFLGLYHVLRSRDPSGFEPYTDVPKTLYGWTVQQFDSAANAQLFTAPIPSTFANGDLSTRVVAGLLIVAMVATTFLLVRRAAPQQGAARYVIVAVVLVSGPWFPIGLSLYWVAQSLFSLAQQAWLQRRPAMATTTT